MKDIGIWIRVSTEDQAQGDSPKTHEQRARKYADLKDWNVVTVYNLAGVSGKNVGDHPETKRMLKDIESGKITGLIFSKLARLARHTKQLLEFSEYFREHDADLISLYENIDTSSPAGRFFYSMIAAMAQWEREEIASRVAASVPIRAANGTPLGGAAPFGYKWENKELKLDPKEASIRKRMYELFLMHKRKRTVARLLNEEGHRTRKGGKFSDTTVARLLEDPIGKGLRRANYTKSTGEGKKWELKNQDDWVFVPAPRIISDEVWEQCNQILIEQKKSHKKRAKIPVRLFSGFVHCHCDDSKMYVLSNSPKYTCTSCRNKIDADALEEIFHEQLLNYFVSEEVIQNELEQMEDAVESKRLLLDASQKEIQVVAKKIDNLMELLHSGEIPTSGFKKYYEPLQEQLESLEASVPSIQAEIDFMINQKNNASQIMDDAQNLYEKWPSFSHSQKRTIVENITSKIIVKEQSLSINLIQISDPLHHFSGLEKKGNESLPLWVSQPSFQVVSMRERCRSAISKQSLRSTT